MKVITFIKRLNANELKIGTAAMHDRTITVPAAVDVSELFTATSTASSQSLTLFYRTKNTIYTPSRAKTRFEITSSNNQKRIYGLGDYFKQVKALPGDEIIIERVINKGTDNYYIDYRPRHVVLFSKLKNDMFEILRIGGLERYRVDKDFIADVIYNGEEKKLLVRYMGKTQKKDKKSKTSKSTEPIPKIDCYDLLIDGESIGNTVSYQNYIEMNMETSDLELMEVYIMHSVEVHQ